MAIANTASADGTPAPRQATKANQRDLFAAQVLGRWNDNSIVAAELAAYEIGMLVAGGYLAHHRAKDIIATKFQKLGVDENHRQNVSSAFLSG